MQTCIATGEDPVLVLFDVDGVFALPGTPPHPADELVEADLAPGVTVFHRPALSALADLGHDPAFECLWLTSWEADAHEIATLAGAPPMRALTKRGSPTPEHWKLGLVLEAAQAGARIVWVDDELPYRFDEDPDLPSLEEFATAWQGQLLLLSPESHIGLTAEHVEQIRAFAGLT